MSGDFSSMRPVVAVDAMGGDFGPPVTVPGALDGARECGCKLILVGNESVLAEELSKHSTSGLSVDIVHASEVVEMDEKPRDILRRKKDSSVQVACKLVHDKVADAMVSAGHSGATVACAMFTIGRIPGVDRVPLATIIPTEKESTVLLDIGSNVDSRPHNLFQFGLMGSAMAQTVLGRANPTVGLLSIGEEEGKGNSLVKDAYDFLKMAKNINFVGNVEGRDLFTGNVDVVVCDGFVGNVALKLAEGLGSSLKRKLKSALGSSLRSRLGAALALPALKKFASFADYAEYGGAPILGLQNLAMISHGKSSRRAICTSVTMADKFVRANTVQLLASALSANEELTLYSRIVK